MEVDAVRATDRELIISRLVNAPLELVWKVWTDPTHIMHWWGPNGFTNTIYEMDLKPGGTWEFIMHGPDGKDYKNKSIYREVAKHERIVYDHVSGPRFRFTVIFSPQDKKTLITIQMMFESAEELRNVVKVFKADEGLRQSLNRLDGYVRKISSQKEMTLARILDAPRQKVFRAWLDPQELAKWWGPDDFASPVCDIDPRPGGKLFIKMRGADGVMYPMDGEYHEIVEASKIVFTSAALDKSGGRLFEALNTVTMSEEDGKTKLVLHTAVSNITEEGKPYIDGMNEGWNQSIDRLTALVSGDAAVIIERIFNVPVDKIWQALTDLNQMRKWYFDIAEFKPEVGFEFQFLGEGSKGEKYLHLCKVIEVIPMKKLKYSWRYDGHVGNSFVTWELFSENEKVRLRLTHEGLDSFGNNGPDFSKENFVQGWTYFMDEALKKFLGN